MDFVGFFLRILSKVMPPLMRRMYPAQKLISRLNMQVKNDGDGMVFQCGEIPYLNLWMDVQNFSPFNITLSELEFSILLGGYIGTFRSVRRVAVPKHGSVVIHELWDLTSDMAKYISRMEESERQVQITVRAVAGTSYSQFEISGRVIRSKNWEVINKRAL